MLGMRRNQGLIRCVGFGPRAVLAFAIAAAAGAFLTSGARAETIGGALAKAYLNNPDINQQRAAVRAAVPDGASALYG